MILENDAKVAIVPGEKNCIHSYHDHLQSSWNKKAIGYPSKTEATQPGELQHVIDRNGGKIPKIET